MAYDQNFEKFISLIKQNFNPLKLVLFGSRAWDLASKSSDYDVLVLSDRKSKSNYQAYEILNKCHPGNISIDLLVRSPEEIEERLSKEDPFFKKIMSEGVLLYERNSR
jgi:predicted nucleotidyltransferase